MPRPAALALLLALCLTGCSGDGSDDRGSSPSAAPSATTPAGPYQEIEFTGGDGQPRQGRLFGPDDAPVAVVLSHMGRDGDSQDDWTATAEALAERGHQVLTYQRLRPRFQIWQDVVGAVEYLRDHGAERVVVAGASLGAMASLRVALQPSPPTDAVVWVAGGLHSEGMDFDQAAVTGLSCPVLLITGDGDSYGATEDTQQLHAWLPGSELLVLPTPRHGTDILADGGAPAEQLQTAMLDFVDGVAAAPASPC
ncbi:hypothetical protein E1262_15425 [Jiangella aurantiaca]|uniref:Uncharacterized protein n=1 Tax=Jiangella aurantiaca TaxID=2530373 RepID=A0A4V2YS28_9ACTN|nr:dienelactone hydrolase family protein [Jiangella aurantiaca]TDD68637.1 hypothetical protein E1262_15425 [Jiangella aurantiaca]